MRPLSFNLSRYVTKVFSSPRSKGVRRSARRAGQFRRSRFERLEDRTVLSATLGSALSIGGAASDGVFDIAADSAGNSYVTGYFAGTVDFDLNQAHLGDADILTARGENDAFVAKYAPDDSLVWVQRMGGDYVAPQAITDVGRDIAVDVSGDVYVMGEFFGSADFGGTTLVSDGIRNSFIAKFDATGSFTWTKPLALQHGRSIGVGVDAQGNAYAMTLRDTTGYDFLKFGASGNSVWTKSIVTNGSLDGDLAISATGNVFAVGAFEGTVDFDPSSKVKSISVGARDASFVLKLDTNGKFQWVSPFSGAGQVYAYSVALDGSGNVVVGGSYSGTIDFNPGRATTTLDPIGGGYVTKLNSSGSLVWARALTNAGSGASVSAYGLAVDVAGNVYVTGTFRGAIDLDAGAGLKVRTSAGDGDIFLVKLSSAGDYAWGETFGGSGLDIGWSVTVDDVGYVHLAGYFTDLVDFDPDPVGTYNLGAAGARRDGFRVRLRQA